MVGLSSPGVGSGLDVKSIVDALVQAEISPTKNRLDKEEASLSTKLSSLGQIKSALAKLQTTMAKLIKPQQFESLNASISNNSLLSATVDPTKASPANYQIRVEELASAQTLASQAYTDSSAIIGTGTLKIEFGSYTDNNTNFTLNAEKPSLTISIEPGKDSLLAIKDAINNAKGNVQAALVKDNSGTRLTLISKDTGLTSSMRISVIDDDSNNSDNLGLSALSFDPSINLTNLSQTAEAQDSKLYINGLLINQSTNQLKDVIEGVNLNLLKASSGETISLDLSKNKEQTTNLVNEFVKQYNESLNTINSLTSYNKDSKASGTLQADAGIRALKFKLGSLIASPVESLNSPIKSLADIGIKTNNQGMLTVDAAVFNKVLNENEGDIASLFAKTTTNTDPAIEIEGLAVSFQNLINQYLNSDGELITRTNQINQNLKNVTSGREALTLRASTLIERYTKQFTALDTLLIQMQGTSQFLTQQLANLPQITTKRN